MQGTDDLGSEVSQQRSAQAESHGLSAPALRECIFCKLFHCALFIRKYIQNKRMQFCWNPLERGERPVHIQVTAYINTRFPKRIKGAGVWFGQAAQQLAGIAGQRAVYLLALHRNRSAASSCSVNTMGMNRHNDIDISCQGLCGELLHCSAMRSKGRSSHATGSCSVGCTFCRAAPKRSSWPLS